MTSMRGVSSFTLAGHIMRTGILSQPHTRSHTSHAFIVNLINPVEDAAVGTHQCGITVVLFFFLKWCVSRNEIVRAHARGRHTCFCVNHSPVSLCREGWLLLALSQRHGMLGGVSRSPRPYDVRFPTPYPLYVSRRTRYKSLRHGSEYQGCQKTVRFHVH